MESVRGGPLDSPDNHQSVVKVVTWMLCATATLCVVVRFWTKLALTRLWTLDDTLISIAWAFSVAQSVCLTVASNYGYGQLISLVQDDRIYQQEKLVFISNILFFFSMCFSMLSTIRLISSLSPQAMHKRISWFMTGMTVVWTTVAVFGFAFQCRFPHLWDFVHGKCFDKKAFYTFVAVFNMIIEVGLVLQPAVIVWNLQLAIKKKVIVILCFFGRAAVVVALIAQITTIWTADSNQETVLYFAFAICTILVENCSIMAASIPYLRPFMESLESGYMGNHDIRRKVKIESGYGLRSGDTYVLSAPATNRQSKVPEVKWQFEEIQPGSERHTASAQSTPPRSQTLRAPVPYPPEEAGNEIGMAIGDESAIQPGGITHTVEYSVRSEPRTS